MNYLSWLLAVSLCLTGCSSLPPSCDGYHKRPVNQFALSQAFPSSVQSNP